MADECRSRICDSAAETERAGAELAGSLEPGDLVLIQGEVGAGKTVFVRGACRALAVEQPVTSPTYTIGQIYRGRRAGGEPLLIAHLDLHRLSGLAGEDPALLDDYLGPDRIGFIEWPEAATGRLPAAVAAVVRIEIEPQSQRRTIRIERPAAAT